MGFHGGGRAPGGRRFGVGVPSVAALALALACSRGGGKAPAGRPPAPVAVEAAQVRAVPVTIEAIGTVTPVATVAVRSQVTGTLDQVLFREGDAVGAGQPLFRIDPRPFRLALRQAEANLARDRAQARSAADDAERYRRLVPRAIVSRMDYEQKVAQARALAATVKADQQAVDAARVNLSYTLIASPIAGRAGSLQVDRGNLVRSTDANPLVVVRQMRPIEAAFSVPAPRLGEIRRYLGQGPLRVVAQPPGGDAQQGALTFVDNAVDPTTGTILLKGTFDNPSEALWPGQFVDVRLVLATLPRAVVVPARSIQPGQQGEHVFVVKLDRTAEARPVRVGERVEGWVAVDGVRPGEQVVTDGLLGLVPGAKVQIRGAPREAQGRHP